ncbi:sensor histidine kinase [Caenimonas koreensis]|uniref:sensor histidine kinase n=1 Tax=Caenimonas koreensis TaxID=367474 RepID=UPI003784E8F6
MTSSTPRLPSLRRELLKALTVVSMGWVVAVFLTVVIGVSRQVDDLMDGALQESAEVLYGILMLRGNDLPLAAGSSMPAPLHDEGLVWQIVDERQAVVLRSHKAPTTPLLPRFVAGFSNAAPDWRVYALELPAPGQALYVGQPGTDRAESRYEVIAVVGAAVLLVGLAFALWLRRRIVRAMSVVQDMSLQVKAYDPMRTETDLPPAAREEFVDIREAIRELGQRLAARVEREQAFSAHAAHALRTPLAGMEVQLALAMKEAPPGAQPRLELARESVNRLKRVVTSLLTLFRSGEQLQLEDIDVARLVALMQVEALVVHVDADCKLRGDANLLAGALANLLDNCVRHGARECWVSCSASEGGQTLTLRDNGPGVSDARRAALQAALDQTVSSESGGLGLKLAALVARAHKGRLTIEPAPGVEGGFAVSLFLGVPGPRAH